MRFSQGTVVASALLLVATVFAVMTFSLSPVARWVPAIVILPTLTLLLFALVLELVSERSLPGGGATGRDATAESRAAHEHATVTSVLLLPALVYAFGLPAAVFAFTYAYLQRRVGAGAAHSLLAAGAVAVFVYGLGRVVLGDRVLQGWLWMQLGLQP